MSRSRMGLISRVHICVDVPIAGMCRYGRALHSVSRVLSSASTPVGRGRAVEGAVQPVTRLCRAMEHRAHTAEGHCTKQVDTEDKVSARRISRRTTVCGISRGRNSADCHKSCPADNRSGPRGRRKFSGLFPTYAYPFQLCGSAGSTAAVPAGSGITQRPCVVPS